MSYYFVIVGPRDNPLFEADLASKPATSSGASSFFSSSSSSSAAASQQANAAGSGGNGDEASNGNSSGGGAGGGGGIFGFGGSLGLGALAGGLSSRAAGAAGGGAGGGRSATTASTADEGNSGKGTIGFGRFNDKHVLQMIAHSSLDVVEDKQFANGAMYMKSMDRINEWTTSAFLVPGNIKFLILHEHKHDDGIRNFFLDVWDLWTKWIQNPFHDVNAPIPGQGNSFEAKVKASARKHL